MDIFSLILFVVFVNPNTNIFFALIFRERGRNGERQKETSV